VRLVKVHTSDPDTHVNLKKKRQAVDGDINILKETVACIYLYVCLMLISCYYDIVEPWNIYVMPDTIEIKWSNLHIPILFVYVCCVS
jgi:hypothetical protein